jgi:hypothetical protein
MSHDENIGRREVTLGLLDVPHFSSVFPTAFPTVIHGVG